MTDKDIFDIDENAENGFVNRWSGVQSSHPAPRNTNDNRDFQAFSAARSTRQTRRKNGLNQAQESAQSVRQAFTASASRAADTLIWIGRYVRANPDQRPIAGMIIHNIRQRPRNRRCEPLDRLIEFQAQEFARYDACGAICRDNADAGPRLRLR